MSNERERETFTEVNQTAAYYTENKHIAERNTHTLFLTGISAASDEKITALTGQLSVWQELGHV